MRVCLFFTNFGPYHVARIAALAWHCTVLPIELRASSSEYLWGEGGFESFSRTTLVPSGDSGTTRQAVVCERLVKALTQLEPDVVAVPGWSEPASLAAIRWARRTGVPVIMMSESTQHEDRRYALKEYLKRQIVGMCAVGLVGGTPHASYMRELGMAGSRIVDGYDVVDNGHFASGAAAARADATRRRAAFGLPQNYFLASSRFLARKNLTGLIAAYDAYRRHTGEAEPWSLVILGYGSQEREIRSTIERRGLAPWVTLAGFQPYDRLPTYYGLAGAFIHPALSEPWGLVVNEAMASGLPPLVSKTCGCAPDLITDGATGFQFDPENLEQLTGLMTRVSSDPGLRVLLSKQAEDRIRDWQPARFARNFIAAAEMALQLDPTSPPLLSRACLWTLLYRAS